MARKLCSTTASDGRTHLVISFPVPSVCRGLPQNSTGSYSCFPLTFPKALATSGHSRSRSRFALLLYPFAPLPLLPCLLFVWTLRLTDRAVSLTVAIVMRRACSGSLEEAQVQWQAPVLPVYRGGETHWALVEELQ